jgi:hypothetical protein
MKKFESKLKEALKNDAAQAPDYWENISQKTNITLNRRMIMEKTTKRNSFKLRYAVPAFCGLALVATLAATNFLGDKAPISDSNITQSVENLQINNISTSIGAKIKLPENGTTETVAYKDYLTKAGMNLDLYVPEGLENTDDAFVYYNADGSEFMMSGYTFHNSGTGAYLTVRFQKDTLPMTDTKYLMDTEDTSTINGEDVVIGYSKDLGAYYSTFIYQGIGYELTGGQGVTQDDFVKVIQSILQ